MDELQEMREQLAALKEKLNKQEVVNDRLIRDILSQKMKVVNKNGWLSGFASLFVITAGNYIFYMQGLSNWFLLGTTLMMIFCCAATWISHSWVKPQDIAHGNLLNVAKQVRRLRKVYVNWKYIAIPMVVVWATWMVLEYLNILGDKTTAITIIISALIGGVLGGMIGFKQNNKVINELDEMVHHIEEMSELDEEDKAEKGDL